MALIRIHDREEDDIRASITSAERGGRDFSPHYKTRVGLLDRDLKMNLFKREGSA